MPWDRAEERHPSARCPRRSRRPGQAGECSQYLGEGERSIHPKRVVEFKWLVGMYIKTIFTSSPLRDPGVSLRHPQVFGMYSTYSSTHRAQGQSSESSERRSCESLMGFRRAQYSPTISYDSRGLRRSTALQPLNSPFKYLT